MNKEQLIALGMTAEQADKVIEGYGAMIPKSRFDEVNNAKIQLDADIAARDIQLEELKTAAGASEDLKTQIVTLQSTNQEAADKHALELKEIAMNNAIKLALTGKVHDEGLAAGLIDKEKLVIDGDKIVGLDEQLAGLKESKAFMFKPDTSKETPPAGFQGKIGTDGQGTPPDGKPASLQEAIAASFAAKTQ